MRTSLVLHPDGEIVEVNLNDGADHLAVMKEHLGCSLVDCVALTSEIDMWVDDEGLYTQPVNEVASALARQFGYRQLFHGPVLLCSVDEDGDSVDLTGDQVVALAAKLADL